MKGAVYDREHLYKFRLDTNIDFPDADYYFVTTSYFSYVNSVT